MPKMTPLERVSTAMQLKEPDCVPVIPVMLLRALREIGAGGTYEVLHDPDTMAQAKITTYRKYGGDALVCGTGLHVEAEALGCEMEYLEEEVPIIIGRVLEDDPSLEKLGHVGLNTGRVKAVADEASIISKEYGSEAVVACGINAPFTFALELRGIHNAVEDMIEDEKYFAALMERSTQEIINYVDILVDHGIIAFNMLDPLCSCDVISPDIYRKWGLPYQKKLADHISSKKAVPMIHMCTYTKPIWHDLLGCGAPIFSGDIWPSLKEAKDEIGDKITLMGNLQPGKVLLNGTYEEVKKEALQCIADAGKGGGFILASGCDTGYNIPDDSFHAMIEAAYSSTYPL